MRSVFILTKSVALSNAIYNTVDWLRQGFEVVGIEHDIALGLYAMRTFCPDIVVLDASIFPLARIENYISLLKEAYDSFSPVIISDSFANGYIYPTLQKDTISEKALLEIFNLSVDTEADNSSENSNNQLIRLLSSGMADITIHEMMQKGYNLDFDSKISILLGRIYRTISDEAWIKIENVINSTMLNAKLGEFIRYNSNCFCVLLANPWNDELHLRLSVMQPLIASLNLAVKDSISFFTSESSSVTSLSRQFNSIYKKSVFGYFMNSLELIDLSQSSVFIIPHEILAEKISKIVENLLFLGNVKDNVFDFYHHTIKPQMDYPSLLASRRILEYIYKSVSTVCRQTQTMEYNQLFSGGFMNIDDEALFISTEFDKLAHSLLPERVYAKPLLLEAIKQIAIYYNKDISLESVADILGISGPYLSRLFKKNIGVSFIEMLTTHRMSIARDLLTDSDMRIGTIASSVGIQDQRYFSVIFRKAFLSSPTEYRRTNGT